MSAVTVVELKPGDHVLLRKYSEVHEVRLPLTIGLSFNENMQF